MKSKLFVLLAIVFCAAAFVSCEDEEAMGRAIKGTWEGDMGIVRSFHGKVIKPTRTVLHFNQETNTSIVGDGIMIEYYNLPELEAVYHHISWDCWKRNNGNPGFEFKSVDTQEEYCFYDDWSITEQWFEGKYPDKDGKDIYVKLKRVMSSSAPDVSKVTKWGYYED